MRASRWLAALALAAGCGYTVNPQGRSPYESVAIPMFANRTLEAGLEEAATRAVADAFQRDNRLHVKGPTESDTLLRGEVKEFPAPQAYTYDKSEVVKEYRVTVVLDLELVEAKSGKTLWHEPNFSAWAVYEPGAAVADEGEGITLDDAKEIALEKLANEVVARTLEGW